MPGSDDSYVDLEDNNIGPHRSDVSLSFYNVGSTKKAAQPSIRSGKSNVVGDGISFEIAFQ